MKKRITRFGKELKKQSRVAIAAAIGFIIAYAWKDYILTLSSNFLKDFLTVMPGTTKLLVAILLTLLGVILILISSKLLD